MKKFLLPLLLLACLTVGPRAVSAQEAPTASSVPAPEKPVQEAFAVLLSAIQNDNYSAFLSVADRAVKSSLKRSDFETLVALSAPRMKEGYGVTYMGVLNQSGFEVHLWKLTFADQGDDVLTQVSWKNGKVGGFLLS